MEVNYLWLTSQSKFAKKDIETLQSGGIKARLIAEVLLVSDIEHGDALFF